MTDVERGQIEAIKYVLRYIRSSRKFMLNRPAAYLAACDEFENACEAAIMRVEHGEEMASKSVTCNVRE